MTCDNPALLPAEESRHVRVTCHAYCTVVSDSLKRTMFISNIPLVQTFRLPLNCLATLLCLKVSALSWSRPPSDTFYHCHVVINKYKGLQGHHFGNSLHELSALGVRYLTVTRYTPNVFAGSRRVLKGVKPLNHGPGAVLSLSQLKC